MRGTVAVAVVWVACSGGSSPPADGALPAAPDPRFKWVGAFPSYSTGTEFVGGDNLGFSSNTQLFGPAAVGSGGEAVGFDYAPTTPVALFSSGFAQDGGSELDFEKGVMTSACYTGFELSYTWQAANATTMLQIDTGGSAGDLVQAVQAAAASGFVTTALAFTGQEWEQIAYADSSTSDTYDTTVQTGDITTAGTMAQAVASDGYVITAFGQIDGSTYGVVGTKIVGSAASHDVMVVQVVAAGSTTAIGDAQAQGYAFVGAYFTDPVTAMFVLER
jgi:hypothetical protein